MQAYTDIVVGNEVIVVHLENEIEDVHQAQHHQNDSDDEKDVEHHHHCLTISIENIFLKEEIQFGFDNFFTRKAAILFFKNLSPRDYLNWLFQPPKLN